MSRLLTHAISIGLIGGGVFAGSFAARSLFAHSDWDVPLNPLGINGSPYGEILAMAMQGQIDNHFKGAMGGGARPHQVSKVPAASQSGAGGSLGGRFENLLASLDRVAEIRTNPKSINETHKRYLRRQVEDKLRFAYQLDPAHYANYNSLHFFLTEPELGTHPELTPSAAKLAEDTIQYCLKQNNDPRPALTAAAAASNILELLFNDHLNSKPKFSTIQMLQYLNLLDHCIARYVAISRAWDQTKNWDLLSPQRITECDERFNFVRHFRDAAEGTIRRIEGKSLEPARL
jgi:hypothetical protein